MSNYDDRAIQDTGEGIKKYIFPCRRADKIRGKVVQKKGSTFQDQEQDCQDPQQACTLAM